MNVVLLTACLMGSRTTSQWAIWLYPAVAISILSLEVQAESLLGATVSLGQLAIAHAIVLAILVVRRQNREALLLRWQQLRRGVGQLPGCLIGPRDRRLAGAILVVVAGVMFTRAVMFVPEAADPYHLVRTSIISTTHSVEHIPVADSKINTLGYLYELFLADLAVGSERLGAWLGLQGLVLVLLYFVAVGAIFAAAGVRVPWYAAVLVCVIPAVFHQGILIKNDLFAALLGLPVLVMLQGQQGLDDSRRSAAAGFMAGLTLSVKVTMLPIAVALALFLPWRPRRLALRTRGAALAGLLGGIVSGGLVLVVALNVAGYGAPAGPVTSGNLNDTVADALVSLWRFVVSWFDASILTRTIWPGRGGWGGAFGPAFVWALAILSRRASHDARARRSLALAFSCLVPFGLIYPDADLAHRMALAPVMLAVVTAVIIEAGRGAFQSWTFSAKSALVCALVALALVGRSSAAYLRQPEYLRSRSLAQAMEPSAGYLTSRPAWLLREAHAQLGDAHHVCTIMQENVLATHGYTWSSAVVTAGTSVGYRHVWRSDILDSCDAVIAAPNDYPAPDDRSAAALARCTDGGGDVTGPGVSTRVLECR